MKKSTSEKLMNLLGVAAGNAILALAVVAFIVPAGIPMEELPAWELPGIIFGEFGLQSSSLA